MPSRILVNAAWRHQTITWTNIDLSPVVYDTKPTHLYGENSHGNNIRCHTFENYTFEIEATSPKGTVS